MKDIHYIFIICIILLILYSILYYKEIENYTNLTNEIGDVINSIFNKDKTIFKDVKINNLTIRKNLNLNSSNVSNLNANKNLEISNLNVNNITNSNDFNISPFNSFNNFTVSNPLDINNIQITNLKNAQNINFDKRTIINELKVNNNLNLTGKFSNYEHKDGCGCRDYYNMLDTNYSKNQCDN